MKVSVLGSKSSYHDQVAESMFGMSYVPIFNSTFKEVISKVESGECQYGVLAIENSVAGTILDNYKMLRNSNVQIVGEKYLNIRHQLMAVPGQKLGDIHTIVSHPMAIKQCQNFIEALGVKNVVQVKDTASAAREISVAKKTGVAAIASEKTGRELVMEVLSTEVQDHQVNYTRFLTIEKKAHLSYDEQEFNKATIVFSVENAPGRLAMLLNYLDRKEINLTKIESIPQMNSAGSYDMVTDLEIGNKTDFKSIMPEVYQLVESIKVLGAYKKALEPWNKK